MVYPGCPKIHCQRWKSTVFTLHILYIFSTGSEFWNTAPLYFNINLYNENDTMILIIYDIII